MDDRSETASYRGAGSYSRDIAYAIGERFRALLSGLQISIRDGSPVATCLSAVDAWANGDAASPWDLGDVRQEFQDGAGFTFLAANVLSVSGRPEFSELRDHFALLTTGNPSNAVNVRTVDEATTKLFELLVACWAIRAGASVRLERPEGTSSHESNPDIIATFENQRILIACKETFSRSLETHVERAIDGAQQIDRAALRGAVAGIVVLHPRRFVPRDVLFPMRGRVGDAANPPAYGAFENEDAPFHIVASKVMELTDKVGTTLYEANETAAPKRVVPIAGLLVFNHAIACCEGWRTVIKQGRLERKYGPYVLSIPFTGLHGFPPFSSGVARFLGQLRDRSIDRVPDLIT